MKPSVARPQPVLNAATLAGSVTAVVGLLFTVLVATGALGQEAADSISAALTPVITGIVGLVTAVLGALKARAQVTPLAAPMNDNGTPLVALPGVSNGPAV